MLFNLIVLEIGRQDGIEQCVQIQYVNSSSLINLVLLE